MYISRDIEQRIQEMAGHFPVILLCGARQVGKTTVLQKVCKTSEGNMNYVTLDYPQMRDLARRDPELLLQQYGEPLVIDEIQYAPELLPYIKIRVDRGQKNGQYFLTGSQMFPMMQKASESLAGRVGILSLYSLSCAEIEGRKNQPFRPDQIKEAKAESNISELFERILKGSMPKMIADKELRIEDFYGSYTQTYLERDIRDLTAIKDESKFLKFLSCTAARTGQELVISDLAKDVDTDPKTIESWMSILVSSGIVFLLQPYFNNQIKRIIKRPKLYFMDTGLACYLSYWNNARALEVSAMSGAFFETYVVSEIVKSYSNGGKDPRTRLCYYRDSNNKEIDLIILEDGKVFPVEIKKSADPGRRALKNFTVLEKMGLNVGEGAVICMSPMILPLDGKNRLVPVGCI